MWFVGSVVSTPGSRAQAHSCRAISCSTACGISADQELNPCLLYWQADSPPLSHQGSPEGCFHHGDHFDLTIVLILGSLWLKSGHCVLSDDTLSPWFALTPNLEKSQLLQSCCFRKSLHKKRLDAVHNSLDAQYLAIVTKMLQSIILKLF